MMNKKSLSEESWAGVWVGRDSTAHLLVISLLYNYKIQN